MAGRAAPSSSVLLALDTGGRGLDTEW